MGEMSGENVTTTSGTENRTHALALMRFFSVDAGSEMNIASTTTGIQVPELKDLWCREFVLKVVELFTGFICITLYSEGLKLLTNSINSMMFPNIVFSSFIIINSIIIFSYLLGCAMPEVQRRIFDVLGMILYFASATVTTFEAVVTDVDRDLDQLVTQKKFLLAASVISYLNTVMYGMDVYFSVKKALGAEIKLIV